MLRTLSNVDSLPYALYRAEQVRHFDQIAIQTYQIPGYDLMKRAGAAAFDCLQQLWPQAQKVLIVAGLGNNGGDGYVIGRLALAAGKSVQVVQLGDAAKIKGDAKLALDDYLAADGKWLDYDAAGEWALDVDLIVDALFGTGLERDITGVWAEAVGRINQHSAAIFSVDIASGIHSDTGRVMGCAVKADACMSFIGMKQGMFTAEGKGHNGEVYFNHLEVPAKVYAHEILSAIRMVLPKNIHYLPERDDNAHKGRFGHVLIVGGHAGMAGAARMAAEAALRVGAGLVSVACQAGCDALLAARPEVMCHCVNSPEDLMSLLESASVIAIGPGLGQDDWSQMLFNAVLAQDKPLVVDADALNLLARQPIVRDNWILTPHPGEAANLLGTTSQMIQQDRFAAVDRLQRQFGGVAVLKGSGTLVRVPDKPFYICDAGNPGMASGGMGDVLTGVIAGVLAQGLTLAEAAQLGVSLHATAAGLAAKDGERGLLATDLMPYLRRLVG